MHLVELNVAEALYPMDDPRMIGFTGRIETINALAERSPGFVWRLEDDTEHDGALDLRLPGSVDILVNMSVWEGVDELFQFVYKTAHAKVMRDRKEWFKPFAGRYLVLWWVDEGHIPDLHEAKERLELLEANGPSPRAFDFTTPFSEAGRPITPNFPRKDCA